MIKEIIRKLFLIREIVSKKGEVHFQRYRILQTSLFSIYIHHILKSDEDKHPHNHPFSFLSIILKGGYVERLWNLKNNKYEMDYTASLAGSYIYRNTKQFHHITLVDPTWTLVFVGKRTNDKWGYLLNNQSILDNESYRILKNTGKL